jgi:hypothetical protein
MVAEGGGMTSLLRKTNEIQSKIRNNILLVRLNDFFIGSC